MVVRRNGDIPTIKKTVDVAAKQESVAGFVFAMLGVGSYVSRIERW